MQLQVFRTDLAADGILFRSIVFSGLMACVPQSVFQGWETTSAAAAEIGRREYVMGTLLEVRVTDEDSLAARVAVDSVFAVVHRLDHLLSNYDTATELSAIGRAAPEPVAVSAETFEFIAQTLNFCERSGGALDFTVGPVVALWGFFGDEPRVPDSTALDSARQLVRFDRVRLDDVALRLRSGRREETAANSGRLSLAPTFEKRGGTPDRPQKRDLPYLSRDAEHEITITSPYPPLSREGKRRVGAPGKCTAAVDSGMALDPGATGKGYALRKAGEAIARLGIDEFYFDFGGQIYWRADTPQAVAIRHPRGDTVAVSVLRAAAGSVSTSGDYERYFEVEGARYAHIIDPRTGWPVRGRAAVSVYAHDPFVADALSTALFVLGPDAGAELLSQFPGAGALFAEWQGDTLIYVTAGSWEDLEER